MKLSVSEVERKIDNAKKAVSKYQEKADKAVEGVVTTLVTTGAGFAMGAIEGYTGGVEIVGVPLPLGAGLLMHGAGFLLDGKSAPYMHAAGNGMLAAWGATMGRGIGKDMKAKGAGNAAQNLVKGLSGDDRQLPGGASNPVGEKLPEDQLRAIAAGKAAAAS